MSDASTVSTIFTAFTAAAACFAAIGAWKAASATKKAKMADLFFLFIRDYSSEEMLNSLRALRDWKHKHGPAFEMEWMQALRKDDSEEHEAAF